MQTNVSTRKPLSRRGFIAGTGALAGTAAALATQAKASESQGPEADGSVFSGYRASMGHLVFDQDKCAGCRNCEIVCSLNKWGVMNTELSCIQIDTDILGGYISEARTCKQCLGPECVAACPTGALSIDPDPAVVAPGVHRRHGCAGRYRCRLCHSGRGERVPGPRGRWQRVLGIPGGHGSSGL